MIRAALTSVFVLIGTVVCANPDPMRMLERDLMASAMAMISGGTLKPEYSDRAVGLAELETRLRTGVGLDAGSPYLRLGWKWNEDIPQVTAGATLIAQGLPKGFVGPVAAVTADGQPFEISTFFEDGAEGELVIGLDMPDGRYDAEAEITVLFGGADPMGALRVDLVPVLPIQDALPTLMRIFTSSIVQELAALGVNPETLVQQVNTAPATIPDWQTNAALLLWLWSEAGKGNPAYAYLRTGKFDSEYWKTIPGGPVNADHVNAFASSVLQNMGAFPRMMEPTPPVLQKIRYRDTRPIERIYRANSNGPTISVVGPVIDIARDPRRTAPRTLESIHDIAPMLRYHDEVETARRRHIGSLKQTAKLADWMIGWTPGTGAALAGVGITLTAMDQWLKSLQHQYPSSIEITATPAPKVSMLADDDILMIPEVTITAKGKPYIVYGMADGVDIGLQVLQIAERLLTSSKGGKALKELGEQQLTRSAADAAELAYLNSLPKKILKHELTEAEKDASAKGDRSWEAKRVPGKKWSFPVSERDLRSFFKWWYSGATVWDGNSLTAKACWNGTNTATVKIDAIPSHFVGRYAGTTTRWAVETPFLRVSAAPSIIKPGETSQITTSAVGAEPTAADFMRPSNGEYTFVSNFSATFKAKDKIKQCREFAAIPIAFPKDRSRICKDSPRFDTSILIARDDGLIQRPASLTCRSNDRVPFQVSHPDGRSIQCRLSGPGALSMGADGSGTLLCPPKPRPGSFVTCWTGDAPGECSPDIPINAIFPDYGVYVEANAHRGFKNELPEPPDSRVLIGTQNDLCAGGGPTKEQRKLIHRVLFGQNTDGIVTKDDRKGGLVEQMLDCTGDETPDAAGAHIGPNYASAALGQGRDISAGDSASFLHGYRDGEDWYEFNSWVDANVEILDDHLLRLGARGLASETVGREDNSVRINPDANWYVVRRVRAYHDSDITVSVNTSGEGSGLVTVLPALLVGDTPLALTWGFDGGLDPVLKAGLRAEGVVAPAFNSGTIRVPGPDEPGDGKYIDYGLFISGIARADVQENGQSTRSAPIDFSAEFLFEIKSVP